MAANVAHNVLLNSLENAFCSSFRRKTTSFNEIKYLLKQLSADREKVKNQKEALKIHSCLL